MRAVRWRRDATAWTYGCMLAGWALLTWAGERLAWIALVLVVSLISPSGAEAALEPLRWPWCATAWGASAGLWLLLFEVGLRHVVVAAWSSHPELETEVDPESLRRRRARVEEIVREAGRRR